MNYIITESQINKLIQNVSLIKEGDSDDKYMKPIGKGGEHEVFNIDSDWV